MHEQSWIAVLSRFPQILDIDTHYKMAGCDFVVIRGEMMYLRGYMIRQSVVDRNCGTETLLSQTISLKCFCVFRQNLVDL